MPTPHISLALSPSFPVEMGSLGSRADKQSGWDEWVFMKRSDANGELLFLTAPLHSVRGEVTGQTELFLSFILPSACVVFLWLSDNVKLQLLNPNFLMTDRLDAVSLSH